MRKPVGPLKRVSFFIPAHLRIGQFIWNMTRGTEMIEPNQAQRLYEIDDTDFRYLCRIEANKYLKEGYEGKNVRNN